MVRFTLLKALVLASSGAVLGCTGTPACDYETRVGDCSASVDQADTWLMLKVARCSRVELRVNNRTRVIHTDDGTARIGSTDENVEVVGCQRYKDNRAP